MTDTEYDEDGNEIGMTTATKTAVLEPTTSTLSVGVTMKQGTKFSQESKEVSGYLKVALPDTAITDGPNGPTVNPAFTAALDSISKQLMNVVELSVARQHGLEVQSYDDGTIRVLGLFPGAQTVATPAVTPGAFSPPAVAAAPAPAPAAAPTPAPAPAPAAPAPGAPAPGAFPAPAPGPAGPPAAGGFATDNPLAWSNQTETMKKWIIATLETWVTQGDIGDAVIENKFVPGERYPHVKVNGVKVSGKMLTKSTAMGQQTKLWALNSVNAGVVIPD
jgi:hypothetical protein